MTTESGDDNYGLVGVDSEYLLRLHDVFDKAESQGQMGAEERAAMRRDHRHVLAALEQRHGIPPRVRVAQAVLAVVLAVTILVVVHLVTHRTEMVFAPAPAVVSQPATVTVTASSLASASGSATALSSVANTSTTIGATTTALLASAVAGT